MWAGRRTPVKCEGVPARESQPMGGNASMRCRENHEVSGVSTM